MFEIWKDIRGLEGLYQVSNFGRVKRLERIDCTNHKHRELILKPKLGRGYYQVTFSVNGKRYQPLIHRLVAQTFIPNHNNLPQVNHKDCNPKNNRADNLEWVTAKDNYNYAPTYAKHVNNQYRSKRVCQYTLDGEFVREWPSQAEIQRSLGISQTLISKCCRGERHQTHNCIWRYAV